MFNFDAVEREKIKIKRMPLKKLFDYGEKLYNQVKTYSEKEQSKDFCWSELESDRNYSNKLLLTEIVNAVFEKENPTIEKCELDYFTIESLFDKSKNFSDFLELLRQSSSDTNNK